MLNKLRKSPFLLIITFLAAIGLGYTLLNEPTQLLRRIFILISTVTGIYALYYYFVIRKKRNQDELSKYRKAVKQSKKRAKGKSTSSTNRRVKQTRSFAKKKEEHPPHLRVIDGKKSSKKRNV